MIEPGYLDGDICRRNCDGVIEMRPVEGCTCREQQQLRRAIPRRQGA